MGADGGTIPKRCELVRNKKKKEKLDKNVENANRWRTCQATQEPLKKPIVACKLGRMYNKEAILEMRLAKSLSQNESTRHIKTLADVKELNLAENRAFRDHGPEKGDAYIDYNQSQWVCPVTGAGMNGTNEFYVNWLCGCVLSARAIQEVPSDVCQGCGQVPSKMDKMIKLYPDEDTLARYRLSIADEEAAKKAEKAAKKIEAAANGEKDQDTDNKKAGKLELGQKRKLAAPGNGEKGKASGSLQDDPNIPKSVKSMFTSSAEAKKQPKAHWVTHNPLYF